MTLGAIVTAILVLGQPTQPAQQAESGDRSSPPMDGFWPTERMIESFVQRVALQAAETFELSDEQYIEVEAGMIRRWSDFLGDNRAELQPLVNEWYEARMGVDPPGPEQVQRWAARAAPMFEKLTEHVTAGNQEISELLTPEQRVEFEAETAKLSLWMDQFGQQLSGWKDGQYAEGDLWDPLRVPPRTHTRKQGRASRTAEPPDQIEPELSAWDRYVAEFIATNQLTDGQRGAAESILDEVKERARAHQSSNRSDIASLEQKLSAPTKADREHLEAEVQRLYGPIDALFRELQERLNTLLTKAQRQAASQPAKQ